jgi:hypothetical protein
VSINTGNIEALALSGDKRLPKAPRLNFARVGVFLVFLRSLSLLDVLEREYLSDFIVICPK